jgi:hypothetical protein
MRWTTTLATLLAAGTAQAADHMHDKMSGSTLAYEADDTDWVVLVRYVDMPSTRWEWGDCDMGKAAHNACDVANSPMTDMVGKTHDVLYLNGVAEFEVYDEGGADEEFIDMTP